MGLEAQPTPPLQEPMRYVASSKAARQKPWGYRVIWKALIKKACLRDTLLSQFGCKEISLGVCKGFKTSAFSPSFSAFSPTLIENHPPQKPSENRTTAPPPRLNPHLPRCISAWTHGFWRPGQRGCSLVPRGSEVLSRFRKVPEGSGRLQSSKGSSWFEEVPNQGPIA